MTRALRDCLGEALRNERLSLTRPTWSDLGEDGRDQWLKRADVLIRDLESHGISVVQNGNLAADPLASPEIYRGRIEGKEALRLIREGKGDADWDVAIASIDGSQESVSLTFSEADAQSIEGRVLAGDASVAKVNGHLTILASMCAVLRAHAARRAT